MKKFIVLYKAPAESKKDMDSMTPEEKAKGMEAWFAWAERTGEHLVDIGAPMTGGQLISNDGSSPVASDIAGFSFVQAEDIDAAKALFEGHPHLMWPGNSGIEIYEQMPLPK